MALLLGSFIAAGVSAQTPEGFFGGGRFSGSGSGGRTSCTFTPASGINFGSPSFACDGELLANYIVELNKFFYRLAIVLAVLMITIGGFQWLSAMGNASKIGNAKETIEQAVIGLALAFTAYLIFSQIDKSFVELKTLDITSGTIDARCDQFLDQDSCQRTEFHPDIQCSWDIAACPDGSQIPGRAPCCTGGSGQGNTLDGTCKNVTITDCTQHVGCYIATVQGQTTCNASQPICIKTKAQYQSFIQQYPTLRPQCCASPQQGGQQTYAWANYVFNVADNCALICGGSGASGWTAESNTICLNKVP